MIRARRLSAGEWAVFKRLRLAALRDAPDAFRGQYEDESEAPDDRWAAFVRRTAGDRQQAIIVGEMNGVAVGVALASAGDQEETASLGSMWVAPTARRRGVGRAMLSAGEDWVRGRGADRLRLAVAAGNGEARTLYESAGFVPTGESEPLREGSGIHVIWLTKPL